MNSEIDQYLDEYNKSLKELKYQEHIIAQIYKENPLEVNRGALEEFYKLKMSSLDWFWLDDDDIKVLETIIK